MPDKTNQEYRIEYSLTVRRESGIEPRIRDYKDKSGGIVSNTPTSIKDKKVVEACKGLARVLDVEELNITIKGR
jgi:hypothetical protein